MGWGSPISTITVLSCSRAFLSENGIQMLAEFLTLVFVAPGLLKIKEFLENVKQKQEMQAGNYLKVLKEK